jgi:hypothetical protein
MSQTFRGVGGSATRRRPATLGCTAMTPGRVGGPAGNVGHLRVGTRRLRGLRRPVSLHNTPIAARRRDRGAPCMPHMRGASRSTAIASIGVFCRFSREVDPRVDAAPPSGAGCSAAAPTPAAESNVRGRLECGRTCGLESFATASHACVSPPGPLIRRNTGPAVVGGSQPLSFMRQPLASAATPAPLLLSEPAGTKRKP